MRRFVIALALILVLCTALCACGGNADVSSSEADSSAEASADNSAASSDASEAVSVSQSEGDASVDDGKAEYKVTVTDADGKAMAGVMVQLCLDTCCPGVTDADGVATFKLEAADYKVSVMTMPEGYAYADDVTEFHFEEGSTALTITLKSAE